MPKKTLILLTFFTLLFTVCSCTIKSCKIAPDYEKIGDSASENIDNLTETNLKYAQVRCQY